MGVAAALAAGVVLAAVAILEPCAGARRADRLRPADGDELRQERSPVHRRGAQSSVAITQWNDGAIEIDVNGHVEATTEPYDMKLQRMVGHLPGLLHPNPKSVLGIGFGAGVSAGTFTRYPGIEHITVCEIEPVIPPTSTRYFGKQNYEVYPQSEDARDLRRRAPLPDDHEGEVRHHRLRSAGRVRERHGGDVFEGVFRGGEART